MVSTSWQRQLKSLWTSHAGRCSCRAFPRKHPHRLLLELPEDRTVPAVAHPGDILVADSGNADGLLAIIKVDPTTGTQEMISSDNLFRNPNGIARDRAGSILMADRDAFAGNGRINDEEMKAE